MEPSIVELEKRIIRSLCSDLEAFVFHEDIVDPSIVNSFIRRHGLGDILVLKSIGKGVYVLLFDERKIESSCLYGICGSLKSVEREICVAKCRRREINTLKTKLLKMLEQ